MEKRRYKLQTAMYSSLPRLLLARDGRRLLPPRERRRVEQYVVLAVLALDSVRTDEAVDDLTDGGVFAFEGVGVHGEHKK